MQRANAAPTLTINPTLSEVRPMADANAIPHLSYRKRPLPPDAELLSEIRRLFEYREPDGFIHRALTPGQPERMLGRRVGHESGRGYWSARVLGHVIPVHRLVWLWHHGHLPAGMLDHINGNRKDNRVDNLRMVTAAQNVWNRIRKEGGYGAGVSDNGSGKFVARIQPQGTGEKLYLGTYATAAEAAAAYAGASIALRGDYSALKRRA